MWWVSHAGAVGLAASAKLGILLVSPGGWAEAVDASLRGGGPEPHRVQDPLQRSAPEGVGGSVSREATFPGQGA